MKRLREEYEAQGGTTAGLAELFATSDTPPHDAFRKRRVRVALEARLKASGPRRRPVRTALVVLTMVGSAAAMGGLLLPSEPPAPAAAPPPAAANAAPPPPEALPPAPPNGANDAAPPAPTAEAPANAEPSAPARPAGESRAPLAKPSAAARVAQPDSGEGEDPTQVVEAVRALRKEHDPKRAQALLDGYLAKNPSGALSEEALALSMEAAAANKSPKAAEYARRYVERYPHGRHAAFARRLLGR